jgi:hypothetical protein
MQFRNPAVVIDETIANLEYLSEFFLDDIDHGALDRDQLTPRAMKAVAALEAARILLPRLRIVRSNHVADSRLPDARAGMSLLTGASSERTSDAGETFTPSRHAGVVR